MPDIDKGNALRISELMNVSPLVAKVLASRGFKYEDAKDFVQISDNSFYDPFLLNDMGKAVDRINSAIENHEKIVVYGDYDVDGITATYILYDYLKSLGADVIYYIPDRIDEGYGMNNSAIDSLKQQRINLIVTVDVGVTAVSEVEYASEVGIDVIVTDHHSLKETLPNAIAVVNPKIKKAGYPFDALAGVGVAFKLIYALSGLDKTVFDKYCDIVAIGTIADMVPLKSENRYIAAKGIEKLKSTSNVGLRALMDIAGIDSENISSTDISFGIAPRLNAAGRMSDAAQSVELLLETNPEVARTKATNLDACNRERQTEEQKIFDEAIKIIADKNLDRDNFILVENEGWAHGIIGIVSSKLTERFYKPSAVVSINPDGSGKASGRSIKGINLFETLSNCSEELVKFGGHELAAGFTVKPNKIEDFRKKINNYVGTLLTKEISTPYIKVDCVISPKDIRLDTISELKTLEPYGIDNKMPTFCMENLKIHSIRYTQNKKHAFIAVMSGKKRIEMPAFGIADTVMQFAPGDTISVVGIMNINNYRSALRPQFIIQDIHSSSQMVCRIELARIFSDIKKHLANGEIVVEEHTIINDKFITALEVFSELDILETSLNDDILTIKKGVNFHKKNNLEDSSTYREFTTDDA